MAQFVVCDFDGTLAKLIVDWSQVRASLGVARIGEIFGLQEELRDKALRNLDEMERVAECKPIFNSAFSAVQASVEFAVLSNNSKEVIEKFFFMHSNLFPKLPKTIECRSTLNGLKEDFELFSIGFNRILRSFQMSNNDHVEYWGDSHYEIEFARQLGADARLVQDP